MTTVQNIEIQEFFLEHTRADWEKAAAAALKGAGLEKLQSTGGDGLVTLPIYGASQTAAPLHLREASLPWTIVQRVDIPEITAANAQILEDLEGGAGGIDLIFPASNRSRGAGINLNSLEDAAQLLQGVLSDLITLRLNCGHEGTAISLAMMEACLAQGIDPAQLRLEGTIDIIGFYARRGWLGNPIEVPEGRLLDLVAYARSRGVTSAFARADGRTFHDAGANATQELGLTLASALYYLKVLERGSIDETTLPHHVSLTLSADADQFLTLIKARALRKLWAALLQGADLPPVPARLHMESSWRMMTKADPWVNLLRGTTSAFAAGVGGADSVCVLPFTSAAGLPNAFARRLARNTQLILAEESNLFRVMDPGAGSGMIEARTDALVNAAWDYFQKIEAAGGVYAALTSGLIAEDIKENRRKQENDVATGKRPLTGTSAYPNLDEPQVDTISVPELDVAESTQALDLPPPSTDGALSAAILNSLRGQATLSDVVAARERKGGDTCPALEPSRLSEPFERLRACSDAYKERHGHRPKVFLASMGKVAQHTARATFATNLYAAGGFECTEMQEFEQNTDIVRAFERCGAVLACLCSEDDVYERLAVEVCALLKKSGAQRITLAGRLPDLKEALGQAGLSGFIFTGCNILEELQACFDALDEKLPCDQEALS
ncbi:methylmalonyl-CoA mutase family protein [Pseudovibrio exalbescens]|uniref:methylmalonyl-CoA mutase family protein n=1 Tax=Pseudovibrio exalbescens TaxID=197461 RepID=UPI001AD8E41F|nr:methylmalonyl-CoA mutase family protein [Pseudovibrio exalbescens]